MVRGSVFLPPHGTDRSRAGPVVQGGAPAGCPLLSTPRLVPAPWVQGNWEQTGCHSRR